LWYSLAPHGDALARVHSTPSYQYDRCDCCPVRDLEGKKKSKGMEKENAPLSLNSSKTFLFLSGFVQSFALLFSPFTFFQNYVPKLVPRGEVDTKLLLDTFRGEVDAFVSDEADAVREAFTEGLSPSEALKAPNKDVISRHQTKGTHNLPYSDLSLIRNLQSSARSTRHAGYYNWARSS
jgi:hypothetical protein